VAPARERMPAILGALLSEMLHGGFALWPYRDSLVWPGWWPPSTGAWDCVAICRETLQPIEFWHVGCLVACLVFQFCFRTRGELWARSSPQ
jgi:hypothetical protein